MSCIYMWHALALMCIYMYILALMHAYMYILALITLHVHPSANHATCTS